MHYRTEWGQSLHVDMTYISSDGRHTRYNLPMQTQDGELWQAETVVMESRQHPVTALVYAYQVEDGTGKVLRREWSIVPRKYAFDSTIDYVFPDSWRDIPAQNHLYTAVYARSVGMMFKTEVDPLRVPLYRRTILLRVSAPQLQRGEVLAVCGNHPAMGSWSPSRYVRMMPIGGHDWLLSINADMMRLPLEYKYVVVDEQSNAISRWENGENRTTGDVFLSDGQVLVLYGEALRVEEREWRIAAVAVSEPSKILVDWAQQVGIKLIDMQPVARRGMKMKPSSVRRLQQIGAYARDRGVSLMGHIEIDLSREMVLSHIHSRVALLETCFDVLSLRFLMPADAALHADYWAYLAAERAEQIISSTCMFVVIEADNGTGMLKPALKRLRPVYVELQSEPEKTTFEFSHVDEYPYRSVAVVAGGTTVSLARWWEEDAERVQRYFVTILHRKGKAPRALTPDIAEDVVARHLFCPSMVSVVSITDLAAMDEGLIKRRLTVNGLSKADKLNDKLQLMIKRSRR